MNEQLVDYIRKSSNSAVLLIVMILTTLMSGQLGADGPAAFALTGPADPPPLGRVFMQNGTPNDGIWGRAGGKIYSFASVAHADNTAIYWGVETQGVKLSLNGAAYVDQEIMTYDAGLSDLPAGIAVWSGQTIIVCDIDTEVDCLPENVGQEATVYTRLQITATVNEGFIPCATCTPVPLVLAADQGLPTDVGALVQFANSASAIDINVLFTASESTDGPWEPHLDFFDLRTDITQDGLAFSTLNWGFYWVNTPPFITTNINNALDEGASVTVTNANLAASDFESDVSNITFTLDPLNSGGTPQDGTLFRDGAPLGTSDTFTQKDIDDSLITYTQNGAEDANDSFTFRVEDEHGLPAIDGIHTVFQHNFNVTLLDDPPIPVSGHGEASLDGVYVGNLQATDADTAPEDLTFSVELVTPGSVELHDATTGSFTYTGPDGYFGDALIDFKVSDLTSTVPGTFTVHIPHPDINLVKTVDGSPVKQPNGNFEVVYMITATNNGQDTGTYDLLDTFLPGAGITLHTAYGAYQGGETRTGTLGAYPLFVQNETLAAGESETWKVTANFVVDPLQVTPQSRDCDPGQPVEGTGFYNRVTGFANETDVSDNDTCISLPKANINLIKAVNGPARLQPDGTYTVEYAITASNPGVGPGIYDLDDTFLPGEGITLNSASAVYSGGESRTGVLGPYGKFVDDETLVSGATESWMVTANFSVNQEQASPDTLYCDPDSPTENTGFYNRVTGVVGEGDLSDNDTCTSPPDPALTTIDHGDLLIASGTKLILHNMPENTDWILSQGDNFTNIFAIAFGGPDQVFVLDKVNGLIRVDPVFGTQTVVAAGDHFSEQGPGSIAIEGDTHVLVANLAFGPTGPDTKLFRVDTSDGGVTTLSSGLLMPVVTSVAIGTDGKVYVGDSSLFVSGQSAIVEVDPSNGDQGMVTIGEFLSAPFGLAVEPVGTILVANAGAAVGGANSVLRVDPSEVQPDSYSSPTAISQVVLSEGGALLDGLTDVTVGPTGRIFITTGSAVFEIDAVTGGQTLVPTEPVVDSATDVVVVSLGGIFADSFEGGTSD